MPLSSFSNNGQSRGLTQQARRRTINQAHQQEQKHSAIQTHHQIQAQATSWIEASLQEVREYQQHIKDDGLHRIEPHKSAKIRVSHNNKVKSQEYQKPIEREALEHSYCGNQRLYDSLNRIKLSDDVLAILNTVK